MQVPQGRWSPGRCWLTACEDTFEGAEYVAPAGTGASGWGENNFDGSVHDLPNSLVVGVADVETWAGRVSEPQPGDYPGSGN